MVNTHQIPMPGFISAETLQAFNNTAAELKKEGGVRNHITVKGKSNPFRPCSVGAPRLSLKNRNLHTGQGESIEQGARKLGCLLDKYGLLLVSQIHFAQQS